jgi:AcrR family transcriptional regulator
MRRPLLLRKEKLMPAPRQARSRRKRDAILLAAVARFGREGFERVSIEKIAQAARVATGGVYQFFRSKRQLLIVLMDSLLRRIEGVTPPSPSSGRVRDEIEQFLAKVFRHELQFVGLYRAWREAALVDPVIADHDRHIRSWSQARIRGWFSVLAATEGARPKLDLENLAKLWDMFFWGLLANPPSDSNRTAKSIASMLCNTFFLDNPRLRRAR